MNLRHPAPKAGTLAKLSYTSILLTSTKIARVLVNLVEEGGFEPPKSLTTDLQSVPFGHSGTPPFCIKKIFIKFGDSEESLSPMELVNGLEPLTC